jgi:hypothetical protein
VVNILAALLAWFVLRPLRRALIESTHSAQEPVAPMVAVSK